MNMVVAYGEKKRFLDILSDVVIEIKKKKRGMKSYLKINKNNF
jgi:hypothetical protein